MKITKLYIILMILIIGSVNVLAVVDQITYVNPYVTSFSATNSRGPLVTPNYNITLNNITKWTGDGATRCRLLNYSSLAVLTTNNFSGDNCQIQYNLTYGKQYIIDTDKFGGSYLGYYNNSAVDYFPFNRSSLYFINGSHTNGGTLAGVQQWTILYIYTTNLTTTPTNFTLTAQQSNGTALTTFNVTMVSGITSYYGTSTSSIITGVLSNSTTLYNITFNATGYIPRIYNNYNVSTNLLGNLTKNTITLSKVYPTNNYHTNERPINITYNMSTNISTTCNLYINNVLNNTQNMGAMSGLMNYLVNLSDANYTIYINCSDILTSNSTTLETFYIDTINPLWTIRTISTSNNSAIDREQQSWIYINDTISDNNLFAYNLTGYYPNGSIYFSNGTFNTSLTQINITRNVTITSSQPNGTYTINYYAEDDHTALAIEDYIIDLPKKEETLKQITFEDSALITIKPEIDALSVEAIKQVDRYNFEFTYPTIKQTRIYHVTSDKKIYYRPTPNRNYPSFVTGKNWIDFDMETKGKTYSVTKISDYDYQITITDPLITKELPIEEEILFKSLGGLNIVNQTYTFQIFVYNPPNITGTYPPNLFSIEDGSNVTFTTNATDPANLSLTYNYYYDNTLAYTGQNYTFTAPFNTHGQHTMIVNVTNSAGKMASYQWNFTITHGNVGPIITSLTYTPLLQWYVNLPNTYITCSGYDQDNETAQENLTYTIQYRTGIFWTTLTPEYISGNTWRAYVNLSTLTGETLDARCKINDGEDETSYTELNDFQIIQEAYYPQGNITIMNPNYGNRDHVIPVSCEVSEYGSVPSYKILYVIRANYNNISETLSIGTNNQKTFFDMSKIEYGSKVSFTCQATDGISVTNIYTTQNLTRTHETKLIMYDNGGDEVKQANTEYGKGLLADFTQQPNITIISSYADCNGDGYYDYYWRYNTTGLNRTQELFNCYNAKGLIKHTIGVFINKTGKNDLFCGKENYGLCKIEKNYDVIVK